MTVFQYVTNDVDTVYKLITNHNKKNITISINSVTKKDWMKVYVNNPVKGYDYMDWFKSCFLKTFRVVKRSSLDPQIIQALS